MRRWPVVSLLLFLTPATFLATSPAAFPAAPFEDTIAQRVLACTGCHGAEGRAASDGYYPRIAGKPADYLFNQLVNFRDGRRTYGLMAYLVRNLSDDYLREMAEHFAALDLPYPPPQPPAEDARTLARGRTLALEGDAAHGIAACAQCHGASLTGVAPAIPGLLGLPRDYLNAQVGAWRIGQRKAHEPDCMAEIAGRIGPDDVAAVTAWLASQPVPAASQPAATLAGPMPMPCGGVGDR